MKITIRRIAVIATALAIGAVMANAGSTTLTSSGTTDASGTMFNEWYVWTPTITHIDSHGTLSGSNAGGGMSADYGGSNVVQYSMPCPGSGSVSSPDLFEGYWHITHGVNGAPYSCTYFIQTTVSWL